MTRSFGNGFRLAIFTALCWAWSASPSLAGALSRLHDPRIESVLAEKCSGIVDDVRLGSNREDVASLGLLAEMYVRGCGIPQDERRAGAVYKRILALQSDSPMANGYLFLNGDDRKKDLKQAAVFFQRAMLQGDPLAPFELETALSYTNEPATQVEASRLASTAARRGDVRSRSVAAFYSIHGYGQTPIDVPKGIRMLRDADRAGDATAAVQLGLNYRDGVGVPVDMKQAEYFLERSVKLGNARGSFELALLYCVMENADAVRAKSVRLITAAQDRVYDPSDFQAALGAVYILEVGVTPDYAKARPLLEDGVAAGLTYAMDNLAYLDFHGLGKPADFASGIRLLRKAAALGDDLARDQLARIHVDVEQTAAIPDPTTDYYYQQMLQHPAQPQNQLPYPGSPAWVNTHDGQ